MIRLTDGEPLVGEIDAGEHVHEPLIQSTLVRTTKDLGIENDLATEYSCSDDGLTWTVKIRDDVKFTDGEQLTASDVAFTFNTCRDESSVNDFTMLKEAVAVDDTTVEFHMNEPYSIWPYTMAIVGIVPEHAYDENYGQNPSACGFSRNGRAAFFYCRLCHKLPIFGLR